MKIQYALYDKATDTGGGKYWTWFEPPLTFELLDRFYDNFAANNYPDLSKVDLEKFPFIGGIVHIADSDSTQKNGWIVLYRSYYGGERDRGRHGIIIITAWIRTNETFEQLLPIFENETFHFVEQHSKECPVPVPAALMEKIGGDLPEKWQKGIEKFAPYITPRFDSHLKITDNPTGLKYEQSFAFAKDRAEWEAKHVEKNSALERDVSILKEKEASLQSSLNDTKQRLVEVIAERNKFRDKYNYSNSGSQGTYIACFAIGAIVVFILMFIISYSSPNWSVNTINKINPFSSSSAKPTLEQQIAEVNEKLRDFDEKKEREKEGLETRRQTLEVEKQRKEQEKQNK